MSQQVWNGPIQKVTILNGAAVSDAFSVPDSALGLTIFMPATLTQASLKITALQPKLGDQDADAYQPLLTVLTGAAAVTQSTVDGLLAAKAYGMDAGVLGGGVFRFETVSGNEGANRDIWLSWRTDRRGH